MISYNIMNMSASSLLGMHDQAAIERESYQKSGSAIDFLPRDSRSWLWRLVVSKLLWMNRPPVPPSLPTNSWVVRLSEGAPSCVLLCPTP